MLLGAGIVVTLLIALFLLVWMRSLDGAGRRAAQCAIVLVLIGGVWTAIEWNRGMESPAAKIPASNELASLGSVNSRTCIECHKSRHASWHRSFHRTMTREATPENVKAIFDGSPLEYFGVTTHMIREGDQYFMETVDPVWAANIARQGIALEKAGPAPRRKLSIDRLVGSHWFQQMLHRDEQGRYVRLPLAYHLVEKRWIHIDGAFLAPDSGRFFSKIATWNESCVFCHNTLPNKNPEFNIPGQPPGYRTEVAELGIACAACHGPGERHVLAHRDPNHRKPAPGEPDTTIVNPSRLPVQRSDDICAHCHGVGPVPLPEKWNPNTEPDPFLAGQDLRQTHHFFWSEAELHLKKGKDRAQPQTLEPVDGRFWGDGTPLTTALEYQGMALSKCYKGGHGNMTCLSCHSMHDGDSNHQLKEGMRTNGACYQCHDTYRTKLVEHTHHAADSSGSLCMNCHMPHQVYSLLDTHRSHRIDVPRVRDSLGTGKPHACNLCHLDKSLGWTQDALGKWYGTKPEALTDDERNIALSVLHLEQSDARTRAVVAGAFGWAPAQYISGHNWPAHVLMRVLEGERYSAVRYLAHRSLRSLYGEKANDYDYLASPDRRAEKLRVLRPATQSSPRPDRKRYPYLPLNDAGFADDVLDRLRRTRNDPDVYVNE